MRYGVALHITMYHWGKLTMAKQMADPGESGGNGAKPDRTMPPIGSNPAGHGPDESASPGGQPPANEPRGGQQGHYGPKISLLQDFNIGVVFV